MRLAYDFHIHSALSPCSENDMTPCNMVAIATNNGLNAIAVSDHNSIGNVQATMEIGQALGVIVVPAIEVQTTEDIHVLALFKTYAELLEFYKHITLPNIKNKPAIFGDQLLYNSDDEVVGSDDRYLLGATTLGVYDLVPLILQCGGLAIPAHIDREANGILSILGDVPADIPFSCLEFSPRASDSLKKQYSKYPHLINSDSHNLYGILQQDNTINVQELSINGIFDAILAR